MFVIGTAGHVDHGKSLLVERLTGIDPDRLAEEKTRGMTIDLGFAWMRMPSGRDVSIIDVPGHERFISNMLAGAGGVEVALLVVAADDGVMPQTREHLAILDLLGVQRGVVALTKCDLAAEDWRALVRVDIGELIGGTGIAGAPVVECSSVTGAGLPELCAALDAALDALPPKRDLGRPRLPIDRVFTIGGFGTVVTGTLIDGSLSAGAELELHPGGATARVRGLQVHRSAVDVVTPGARTAVNLAGVPKDQLRRGMVLAAPGVVRAAEAVDVRLRALPSSPRPLRHNMRLTFHSGAAESPAQLRLLEDDELRGSDEAWAQIRLGTPIAVLRGDRFIVRTPDDTVGGGVIVDVSPPRHRRRHAPTLERLAARASQSPLDMVREAVGATPFIAQDALLRLLPVPTHEAQAAIETLVNAGDVVVVPDGGGARYALPAHAAEIARVAVTAIEAYHRAHPLRPGMPVEELRARTGLDARAFAAASPSWPDLRIDGAHASLRDFAPALDPAQRAAAGSWLGALERGDDAPPPDPDVLAFLVERGDVVDCGNGVLLTASTFGAMSEVVRACIERQGRVTLAQARDALGTGRKQAQALLETLDRRRITVRQGGVRILRAGPTPSSPTPER